jgi:polyadenylate-binding protein
MPQGMTMMSMGVPPMNIMPGMQGNIRYNDNRQPRSNQPLQGQQLQQGVGQGQQGQQQGGLQQGPGGPMGMGGNANVASQGQEPIAMPAPNEPLTIKALAAAPEEMRKQMIGERLFPLIKMQEPLLAGKITGMLLEMDNGELIHLLESQHALNEKIVEALQVLQQHPTDGGEEETDK